MIFRIFFISSLVSYVAVLASPFRLDPNDNTRRIVNLDDDYVRMGPQAYYKKEQELAKKKSSSSHNPSLEGISGSRGYEQFEAITPPPSNPNVQFDDLSVFENPYERQIFSNDNDNERDNFNPPIIFVPLSPPADYNNRKTQYYPPGSFTVPPYNGNFDRSAASIGDEISRVPPEQRIEILKKQEEEAALKNNGRLDEDRNAYVMTDDSEYSPNGHYRQPTQNKPNLVDGFVGLVKQPLSNIGNGISNLFG